MNKPAPKRGPRPGSGGRPRNTEPTVRLNVLISQAARRRIDAAAAAAGLPPGRWLSQHHAGLNTEN